jgi:hypothetical protein
MSGVVADIDWDATSVRKSLERLAGRVGDERRELDVVLAGDARSILAHRDCEPVWLLLV